MNIRAKKRRLDVCRSTHLLIVFNNQKSGDLSQDESDLFIAEKRLEDVRAGRSKSHTVDEVERELKLQGMLR